ncbi:MAG TPA: hypothetical protein VGU27_04720, partial [Candidatus Eisenbacteria bacterium]|nr:hypothetical protein [Candidatus Eisenbacteria bacterium]
MPIVFLFASVPILIGLLHARLQGADQRRRQACERDLERLQACLAGGDWTAFEAGLGSAVRTAASLPADDRPRFLAGLELLRGEACITRGRADEAKDAFLSAIDEAGRLSGQEAAQIALRAKASLAIALDPHDPDPDLLRLGEEALASEAEVVWPTSRARLAQGALAIGRFLRSRELHARADAALAACVRIGGAFPPSLVRSMAGQAALELASHRLASGREEEARANLDHAATLLEPCADPEARVAYARVQLARAHDEANDPLVPHAARAARYRSAVAAGEASGRDEGFRLVARARLDLGFLAAAEGRHADAAAEFEAARAALGPLTDPVAALLATQADMACGEAWLAAGERGRGREALRAAVLGGLSAAAPAARQLARQRAVGLHLLCLQDRDAGAAREVETALAGAAGRGGSEARWLAGWAAFARA